MAINFSDLGGNSSGVSGNFVINTGDYSSDTAQLSRDYEAGAYGVLVSPTDATLDIYLIASDGSLVGYSNIGTITATAAFDKVVVLGSTSNTSLSFSFNGESQTVATKGQLANVGAVVSSVVTSSLPSVDDTTVVNGGNFAADVEVTFIGQSEVETAAKTVVRSSSTQLIVTRPDAFSPDDSPYTVKVVNPGIPVPAGTSAYLLSNSVTAGTNPVWTTSTNVFYNVGSATSYTFLATDTEATDIDYSVVSGTLPAGLTLDGETGVLSGTASGTPSEGNVTAVTIRANDTGGNFLDKAFNITANVAPTWTTSAISGLVKDTAYSFQLVASGGSAGGALTYTLQSGALLSGHSLSSTGLISGTSNAAAATVITFTIRVTDEAGLFVDREFTMEVPKSLFAPSSSDTILPLEAFDDMEGDPARGQLHIARSQGTNGLVIGTYSVDSSGDLSLVRQFTTISTASSARGLAISKDGTKIVLTGGFINAPYWNISAGAQINTVLQSNPSGYVNFPNGDVGDSFGGTIAKNRYAVQGQDPNITGGTNSFPVYDFVTGQSWTVALPGSTKNTGYVAYDEDTNTIWTGAYNTPNSFQAWTPAADFKSVTRIGAYNSNGDSGALGIYGDYLYYSGRNANVRRAGRAS
jgi:hypothetical protein